jgi:hypothetical protein
MMNGFVLETGMWLIEKRSETASVINSLLLLKITLIGITAVGM